MAGDTNVRIMAGAITFYFPGCTFWRRLDKDLTLIPLPAEATGIDLLLAQDTIRLTGEWQDDDVENLYDGKTAFQRYKDFWTYCKVIGGRVTLTWSSGAVSETLSLMPKSLDMSKASGEGKRIEYNFRFAVVKPPES